MGRRSTGCDFCRNEEDAYADAYNSCHSITITKRPFTNALLITSGAINERSEEYEELMIRLEYNYCPVCGAKIYDGM